MGFSNLNYDLYSKGCVNDGTCACGIEKEDAGHYFLRCNRYAIYRNTLIQNIQTCCDHRLSIPLLYHGHNSLSEKENMLILKYVYQYINETKRF